MELFGVKKAIIGVVYLLPLLGKNGHSSLEKVIEEAAKDMAFLVGGGVDAVLLENEYDDPYTLKASPSDIAGLSVVMAELRREFKKIPMGVEFLLNDPIASLSIAKAANLDFIRTDYFVDRMAREEYGGEIEIDPEGLIKFQKEIDASKVQIFSDIQVKYATLLEEGKTLAQSASQAREKGSSGIVVSASKTGSAPTVEEVLAAKEGAQTTPVLIGSGLDCQNVTSLFTAADAAIVGSSMMTDGRIVQQKVIDLVDTVKRIRDRNIREFQ
ncbi:MAG: BtpA/SgcQ family protein [Halobacteriovoraceae bacterium]|nr:BtpA/SgcQ family protein [Halobacteriovoraceae bacterium]MBT5095487.1 BtpA/SgcQ family protein [Halobacteriovoraceae bacterium]